MIFLQLLTNSIFQKVLNEDMSLYEETEHFRGGNFRVEQHRQWEMDKLRYSSEKIWQLNLPEKVRRILLLIKCNLGTNPHIFVDGKIVKNGGLAKIVPYLRGLGWRNIQASTSTLFDKELQESPVLQVSSQDGVSNLETSVEKCGDNFFQNITSQSKPIFEKVFHGNKETAINWFWGNSIFIFYPNRWGKETTGWVGGNFSIETKLNTPKRDRLETMKIEAAPAFMSADVANFGVGLPGYRYYGIGETDFYPNFGLITKNNSIHTLEGLSLNDPKQIRRRDVAMYSLWRDLTKNPNFRSSLRELQDVTGTEELFVNWYYHEDAYWPDNHKVVCFDFDRVIR